MWFFKKNVFLREMFLMLYSISWPNFIVWLSLIPRILGSMRVAVVCFPFFSSWAGCQGGFGYLGGDLGILGASGAFGPFRLSGLWGLLWAVSGVEVLARAHLGFRGISCFSGLQWHFTCGFDFGHTKSRAWPAHLALRRLSCW